MMVAIIGVRLCRRQAKARKEKEAKGEKRVQTGNQGWQ